MCFYDDLLWVGFRPFHFEKSRRESRIIWGLVSRRDFLFDTIFDTFFLLRPILALKYVRKVKNLLKIGQNHSTCRSTSLPPMVEVTFS